jgi:hypothetical protein
LAGFVGTALEQVPVTESYSLIDDLVVRFPRLFRGQSPKRSSDLPTGWYELAVGLFIDIDRLLDDQAAERFDALQVTERFAGLRIYWRLGEQQPNVIHLFEARGRQTTGIGTRRPDAHFERVKARVNAAAVQASKTCQLCGQPGSSGNSKGWKRTLCGRCIKPIAADGVVRRHELQRDSSRP